MTPPRLPSPSAEPASAPAVAQQVEIPEQPAAPSVAPASPVLEAEPRITGGDKLSEDDGEVDRALVLRLISGVNSL